VIRTQVQLTKAQADGVRRLAARRKVSAAAIVREAIDEKLRRAIGPDREELWARALAVAGRFRSETGDLSVNHDKYFAEEHGV
jgi:hypothetical protein